MYVLCVYAYLLPLPTVKYTAPPRPDVDVPVPMYNAPLLLVLAPVDRIIAPLLPVVPELAVCNSIVPDVVVEL
jgi:hypothetical protein